MKITKVTMKNGERQRPVTTSLLAEVERMHSDRMLDGRELPQLIVSTTFGRGGFDDVNHLTGLLLLTAASDSEQTIGRWQQLAMQVPYTVVAFRSINRRKLHIVVRIGFADGHEPQSADEYLRLLRQASCVEMTGQADMSGTINYRQMYAQAVWEINNGVQYWFDNDDEREIVKHNAKYQMCSTIEDTINSVFVAAERKKEHFMTATEIQQKLRGLLLTADVPTLSKLGRALRRQHIPDGSQNGIHGYYLHLRKQNQ